MTPRIIITIDRGDVRDWLSGGDYDDPPSPEQITRWVGQYADSLKGQMARLNPGHIVAVEWGSGMMGHKIAIENVPMGAERDLLESLELDYQVTCDRLNAFDWMEIV